MCIHLGMCRWVNVVCVGGGRYVCLEKGSGVNVVCVGECGLSGWIIFEGDTSWTSGQTLLVTIWSSLVCS